MEQEIILEGIHAMLEEIRDNMKRNLEVETIKSKLNFIEKVCNELTGQKFVIEDVLAQFLACTLQKTMEMNKKQEEKIEKLKECITEYYGCLYRQSELILSNIGISIKQGSKLLEVIESKNNSFYKKIYVWLLSFYRRSSKNNF